MKTVLVCGSRKWLDHVEIYLALDELRREVGEPMRLIHGDYKGADRIAGKVGEELGYTVQAFPADWATHKGAAGPIRNRQMRDEDPFLVLAFGSGHGTEDMVRISTSAGIEVRRYAVPSPA